MGQPLPGFEAPAAGFDQPFALLHACHERVQRTLALLQRLLDHVQAHGVDAAARSAAADVLRYFDLAAPLHHEDEEAHVFPPLLANGTPELQATVRRLQQQHHTMASQWELIRPALLRWRDGAAHGQPDAALRAAVAQWCVLYAEHIATEESRVFPAALAALDEAALQHMGAQMQARRHQR
jgi:hemerythrin-like domain-containing protein